MSKIDGFEQKKPKILPDTWGDQNIWILISRETKEGIFRETKVMDLSYGCLIHVSTTSGNRLCENMVFVEGCKVKEEKDGYGNIVKRTLIFRG